MRIQLGKLRLLWLRTARVAKVQAGVRGLPADQQKLRGFMNGYNFTERVRKSLAMAREEAARLRHAYVGTEHILLGLLREGEGVASTALQNLAVDADALAEAVERMVKSPAGSAHPGPDLPYTSRAKKVLEFAMAEARNFNHAYVGTEHLLLGLVAEQKGLAAQVLVEAGVTLNKLRAEVLRILGTSGGDRERTTRVRMAGEVASPIPTMADPVPERVRVVMTSARTLAAQRGAAVFEPAHLAIALVGHGEGTANAALKQLQCDRERLLTSLNGLAPDRGKATPPEAVVDWSAELQQTLITAHSEQNDWKAPALATHHVLIALLASDAKIASVFSDQGVTLDRLRDEVRRIVG